jgi:hypothetical protein
MIAIPVKKFLFKPSIETGFLPTAVGYVINHFPTEDDSIPNCRGGSLVNAKTVFVCGCLLLTVGLFSEQCREIFSR